MIYRPGLEILYQIAEFDRQNYVPSREFDSERFMELLGKYPSAVIPGHEGTMLMARILHVSGDNLELDSSEGNVRKHFRWRRTEAARRTGL